MLSSYVTGRPDPATEAAASRPDAATPRPDAAAPRPDAAKPRPDAAAPRPDAAAPRPDAATPRPDAATPPPDAATPPPDAATHRPDATTPRPRDHQNGSTPNRLAPAMIMPQHELLCVRILPYLDPHEQVCCKSKGNLLESTCPENTKARRKAEIKILTDTPMKDDIQ